MDKAHLIALAHAVAGVVEARLERQPTGPGWMLIRIGRVGPDMHAANFGREHEAGAWLGAQARGPGPGALYRYAPAKPDIIAKTERIAAVCRRHDVPIAAAALQLPMGHRSVVSVIPGPVAPEQVHNNVAWMQRDIPDALWAELKVEGLIAKEAPTPRLGAAA